MTCPALLSHGAVMAAPCQRTAKVECVDLRVCYFGTYDQDYARTEYILEGLRRNGVEVVECHRTLWHGTADKAAKAAGGWKQLRFLIRLAAAQIGLIGDYVRIGPHDAMIVGYTGQIDVYLAWLLTRFSRRPLVLDALLSVYNSIVNERKLVRADSNKARLLYALERNACRLADRVLLDTQAHIRYFSELYHLEESLFVRIPISADDRFFRPLTDTPRTDSGTKPFRVVYHGKYIPNAGVEYIIRSAALLSDDSDITFEFIGTGEGKADAQQLATTLCLENVTFLGWMEKPTLARHLRTADVCLGNFGHTPQAQRAVSNKLLEGLAVGIPVLTGDTPANREVVRHGETAYLCPCASPEAIANGIRALKADPTLRARLSAAGMTLFREQFAPGAVGRRLQQVLEQLIGQ